MNTETRQNEIRAQLFKKSSIIVERFPVYNAQTTVADQAISMTALILEKKIFVKTDGKDVMLLLSWIY